MQPTRRTSAMTDATSWSSSGISETPSPAPSSFFAWGNARRLPATVTGYAAWQHRTSYTDPCCHHQVQTPPRDSHASEDLLSQSRPRGEVRESGRSFLIITVLESLRIRAVPMQPTASIIQSTGPSAILGEVGKIKDFYAGDDDSSTPTLEGSPLARAQLSCCRAPPTRRPARAVGMKTC